jgi:hypothetical protein
VILSCNLLGAIFMMKQKQLQWNIGLRRIAELINSYTRSISPTIESFIFLLEIFILNRTLIKTEYRLNYSVSLIVVLTSLFSFWQNRE